MPFITQGKTNWKFLLIVIVLAIIVGGGALWYARRPEKPYQPVEIKKSEIADWKTYRNDYWGFEFKYPPSYDVNQFAPDSHSFSLGEHIFLNINSPEVPNLEQYVQNHVKDLPLFHKDIKFDPQETLLIGGEKAIKLTFTVNSEDGEMTVVQFIMLKGDKIYFFGFSPVSEKKVTNAVEINRSQLAILNNIVSTFKFLDLKPPENPEFTPITSQPSPSFIKSLNNAQDVKIDPHYEGDYPGFSWPEPEFYTPAGSSEKFLSLSKLKERSGEYAYGPDYNSIFNAEGSHWYGGAPIYLLDPKSKYTVSYIGLKINNKELVSELTVEFGIDYGTGGIGKSKSSIFSSIFGIDTAYACGPGLYLRPVGDSNLIFVEESNGIEWYSLEKPVAIYNLSLSYCDQDCSSKPSYCNNMADDPVECEDFWCCFYNSSILSLENGNLRMHIYYKPNDKEGFLKLQMANLILSDPAGTYYQPIMGEYFDHYYRAYLH